MSAFCGKIMGTKYANAPAVLVIPRGVTQEGLVPMYFKSTTPETNPCDYQSIPIRVAGTDNTTDIILDLDDIDRVLAHNWSWGVRRSSQCKVYARINFKYTALTRFIIGDRADGNFVHFKNSDNSDFRKNNLVIWPSSDYHSQPADKSASSVKVSRWASRLNDNNQQAEEFIRARAETTQPVDRGDVLLDSYSQRSQRRRGKSTPVGIRNEVLDRDAGICFYCGYEAEVVDHIIPYVYGGKDDLDNLIASCSLCNGIAADKVFDTLQEKRDYVRGRYGPYMEGRYRRFLSEHSVCADCEEIYNPAAPGASNVLCPKCYAQS